MTKFIHADKLGNYRPIEANDRAVKASKALDLYPDRDSSEAVTDLLADLMHYCHEVGVDFANVLRIASMHFREEQREEIEACQST